LPNAFDLRAREVYGRIGGGNRPLTDRQML
jgi:hypothetical protein